MHMCMHMHNMHMHMCMHRYNMRCDVEKLRAPVVKLRTHNIHYDFAFIAPHIRRINTIVRGTSIVCGTARYYCNTGEALV